MTDPVTDTTTEDTRAQVVERYSGLARKALAGQTPTDTCGAGNEDCLGADQYGPDAPAPKGALRASLGCGNPHQVAAITPGETVLDLGSGGGLDVIVSARRTGPTGKVYGLDASPDMIKLATANATEAGLENVEFLLGHIEDVPLPDRHVDVVISNCVINLSPDKTTVLAEAFRVLRPGGRLGVSDIIADPDLPAAERTVAEQSVGCTTGTLTSDQYRDQLLAAGFTTVTITPTHEVGPGLNSAIIQANRPAAPAGPMIRPM